MNKNGILKVDIPDSCMNCTFASHMLSSDYAYFRCLACGYDYESTYLNTNTKPDTCPIQPLASVEQLHEGNDPMHSPIGFVNILDLLSCIDHNSMDTNLAICIEELAELQKALCKYIRYDTYSAKVNVLEELSDVLLVCGMIQLMLGTSNEDLQYVIEYKNKRNVCRLPSGDNIYITRQMKRVITHDMKCIILEIGSELNSHATEQTLLTGQELEVVACVREFVLFTTKYGPSGPTTWLGIASKHNITEYTEELKETGVDEDE